MKKFFIAMFLVMATVISVATPVHADKYNAICDPASPNYQNLAEDVRENVCNNTVNDERSLFNIVQFVINIALGILGIVAVIVLIIAGQRYITAQGDPGKLKMAKDMILWGLVGLIVAVLASAIINFVITEVPGDASNNLKTSQNQSGTLA